MNFENLISQNAMPFAGIGGVLFIAMMLWSLVWKGFALWRAARRKESTWFIILLIFNTIGILEIIYYFLIAKTDKKE